jgi:hypothetical protein
MQNYSPNEIFAFERRSIINMSYFSFTLQRLWVRNEDRRKEEGTEREKNKETLRKEVVFISS